MQKIKILTGPNGTEKIQKALEIITKDKTDFIRLDFTEIDNYLLTEKMYEAYLTDKYLILDNFNEDNFNKLLMVHLCSPKFIKNNEHWKTEPEEYFTRPNIIIMVDTTKPINDQVASDFYNHYEVIKIHSA